MVIFYTFFCLESATRPRTREKERERERKREREREREREGGREGGRKGGRGRAYVDNDNQVASRLQSLTFNIE